MNLPYDSLITREKLKEYLLQPKKKNDKSQWLAQAGYSLENWQSLENDLCTQILSLDATPTEKTRYGQMYEIKGRLIGPNGKALLVCTIWMTETESDITKFITMYPDKRSIYR